MLNSYKSIAIHVLKEKTRLGKDEPNDHGHDNSNHNHEPTKHQPATVDDPAGSAPFQHHDATAEGQYQPGLRRQHFRTFLGGGGGCPIPVAHQIAVGNPEGDERWPGRRRGVLPAGRRCRPCADPPQSQHGMGPAGQNVPEPRRGSILGQQRGRTRRRDVLLGIRRRRGIFGILDRFDLLHHAGSVGGPAGLDGDVPVHICWVRSARVFGPVGIQCTDGPQGAAPAFVQGRGGLDFPFGFVFR